MKGTPFAALRDVVLDRAGEDAWDAVLDRTGQDGTWTTVGTYEPEEFAALADATAAVLHVPLRDLLRKTGGCTVRLLLASAPELTARHPDAVALLSALPLVLRSEVRKVDPTSHPPLRSTVVDAQTVELDYGAPPPQCLLLEGTIEAVGDLYETRLHVEHLACAAEGDEGCHLRVRVRPRTAGAAA